MKLILTEQEPLVLSFKKHKWFSVSKRMVMTILMGLIVANLVTALTLYLFSLKTDYTVDSAVTVLHEMPTTVLASAGDYYNYPVSVTNTANRRHNFSMVYWLNSSAVNITSGDAKIRLLDANNVTVLAESTTVADGSIAVTVPDVGFNSKENRTAHLSVEFHPAARTGTYNLNYQVRAGSHSYKS